MKNDRLRRLLVAAASALLTTSSTAAPVATAQVASSSDSHDGPAGDLLDGPADAANCAAHGYAAPYGWTNRPVAIPAPPATAPVLPSDSSQVAEVVVTGSLLRGLAEDAALPVEVFTRQERSAPSKAKPRAAQAPPPARVMAPPPAALAPAPVEMRNLGSGRTPAQVNGQRADLGQAPGTERYPSAVANPIHQAVNEPVSTFSIDVDTASYSNVRRFLAEGRIPPADAVRVEEMVNYFDYGYASPTSRETPFSSTVAVVPSPWAAGKQLIHIGVQGFKPPKGEEPPLNLVFLVDTSGSMMEPDRLPLAQKSLNVLIDQLRPQDHVAMVAYAGSAGEVLAPTAGREKLKMRCAVNALQAGGSTAGGAGLSLAYNLAQAHFDSRGVNRIVLMTDGDFNVGVTDNKSLEQFVADKRKTGVYLSIYGFGRGNYQDARMQAIAQNGNGTAAYIDGLREARRIFVRDFEGSMFPIADDVKIQVEFNPTRVAEYRLIGYETRLLRREDFNNDAIDAGEVGAGASVTALYEVTPVGGPVASDPLRYGSKTPAASASSELAYLKLRYKLPGQSKSRLMEQPIGTGAAYADLGHAPEATRWATAVAAYGQKLAGSAYLTDATFTWEQDVALAQTARGADPDGSRAEFIDLVRSAKDLRMRSASR